VTIVLSGNVAIVTGGAHGIGRATARRCAGQGASVVVADINGGGAEDTAREIEAAGGTALAHQVDLTSEEQVAGLMSVAVERFGRLDALVNDAYAIHPGAFSNITETSLEAWEWTMRTCLTSQFLCCRAALPHMVEGGSGSIVNFSSGSGLAGAPRIAPYGVAKAGVIALTKYIATQYGKRGVRCNTVVPGWTVVQGEGEMTPEMERRYEQAIPDVCMNRLGEPEDLASVVTFLLSDDAGYVQGATVEVNGGLLAHLPGSSGAPGIDPATGLLPDVE
jgi:NAD(P)-dependent dehydrogenase (short-subunit alcohol dehydrogenase family)